MLLFIVFVSLTAVLIFFPYRRVFNHLNHAVDARGLLSGVAIAAFGLFCRYFLPALGDPASDSPVSAFAIPLSWLFVFTGSLMAVMSLFSTRKNPEEKKEMPETPSTKV